ncbi:hypothetical protein B0H14DRAFT_2612791 [Mycena olivaceomarginata]|nr:hypothetical protein B0H14DRAFT_2612791 [Mycena olivaceomarginata]
MPSLLSKGTDRPRWNNILQEQLLNTHLAYLSDRAYVFPGYIARDHPPLPDTLPNGDRHPLHIPANAFTSGSTTGGPLSSDGADRLMRRAVSEEWYNIVCPRTEVVTLDLYGTTRELGLDDNSEGVDIMARWAKKLSKMNCTNLQLEAVDLTLAVVQPGSRSQIFCVVPTHHRRGVPELPASQSAPPAAGPHPDGYSRNHRAPGAAPLNATRTTWIFRQGQSRGDAAFDHCWPSAETIVSRVNAIRQSAESGGAFPSQNLRRIYIATNGDPSWIGNLAVHLRADGWDVSSSFDMQLTLEERTVAQAVDMSVLAGAESFIGAGFSSLTSNVVQIRLAGGKHPETIHFW